jgi:hypothetical protein
LSGNHTTQRFLASLVECLLVLLYTHDRQGI